MTTVNIHEAKTHLSRLLERVQTGETITIAKAGRPVAQLAPYPRVDVVFGFAEGQINFDFDEFQAADEDLWPDEYRRTGGADAPA